MMIGRTLLKTLVAVIACVTSAPIGRAADPDASMIRLEIRTLRAKNEKGERSQQISTPVSLDSTLEDLRPKLQKLHFRKYKLLGTEVTDVGLLQKVTVPLISGDTLTVRLLEVANRRIGLWLKWRDKAGNEVLDTRMHFNSGESMLAGTDSDANCGIVLAIKASPVN